jgi:hypothetical protein
MSPGRTTLLACSALLLVYSAVCWSAVSTKGATFDEPYHALAAWLQLHHHDYRLDNEDPPLWMYYASLPNRPSALKADFDSPYWQDMPRVLVHQWFWGVKTLYRTPANDPVALVRRCRLMMLVASVLLGATIARWSFDIGGSACAIIATAAFALDPNFLAHGALMKNDVVFALSFLCLVRALWRGGQSLSSTRIVWLGLLCVFTLSVKFTGLIAISLVPVLLALRALLPSDWPVLGVMLNQRRQRLAAAAAVTLFCVLISIAGVWAVYGFRFRPTPEPGVWLNMTELALDANLNQQLAKNASAARVALQADNGPVIDIILFANRHGLLPQPYLAGFLFTYANSLARQAFLFGQRSVVGWWYYFPAAMLVKTPLSTMLAAAIAAFAIIRRRWWSSWTALCLAVPFLVFLIAAMSSHFNIGIRHILPIYPLGFVAIGFTLSRLWQGRKNLIGVLGVVLAVESLACYPNFIPFFNVAAVGLGGGKLNLLSDSNFDWGQDLPALAAWQRANPDVPLYLSYFGYADPSYFGIRYIPLPGGYHFDPPPKFPQPYEHCVIAISATNLQGELEPAPLREYYARCQKLKLIGVLNETIYLFASGPGW